MLESCHTKKKQENLHGSIREKCVTDGRDDGRMDSRTDNWKDGQTGPIF